METSFLQLQHHSDLPTLEATCHGRQLQDAAVASPTPRENWVNLPCSSFPLSVLQPLEGTKACWALNTCQQTWQYPPSCPASPMSSCLEVSQEIRSQPHCYPLLALQFRPTVTIATGDAVAISLSNLALSGHCIGPPTWLGSGPRPLWTIMTPEPNFSLSSLITTIPFRMKQMTTRSSWSGVTWSSPKSWPR